MHPTLLARVASDTHQPCLTAPKGMDVLSSTSGTQGAATTAPDTGPVSVPGVTDEGRRHAGRTVCASLPVPMPPELAWRTDALIWLRWRQATGDRDGGRERTHTRLSLGLNTQLSLQDAQPRLQSSINRAAA